MSMTNDLTANNLANYIRHLETEKPAVLEHQNFSQFVSDLETYLSMPGFESRINFWPCLDDKSTETPLDKYYFYQDTWAAKKVLNIRPFRVVDVGSTALLVGIFSQIAPTTSIDVRPLPVSLPGLTCKQGTITSLPFDNNTVEFLSSMCVIEHVGLGRYGDEIDTQGSLKAFKEVSRVLKIGGHLLFSVPLSSKPGLLFNAHRIFSKPQVLTIMSEFALKDELFLFPEPSGESNVVNLQDFQYCVWCAHMVKNSG
jgi:SAM-dependent methyltransferase